MIAVDRLAMFRVLVREKGVDAFLVTGQLNTRYLSGFTGSAGSLLVTAEEAYLLTDFRYGQQAGLESPGWTTVIMDSLEADLAGLIEKHGLATVGCEGEHLTYNRFTSLSEKLKNCKLAPLTGLVEKMRARKDSAEVEKISKSAALCDRAFNHLLGLAGEGMTELEAALELEYYMRKNGAQGPSFPIIVASGPRSSLPHGGPTGRVLMKGDLVVIDFGALLNGYCSDMTRTLAVGKPDQKSLEIYGIVLEALTAGINAVRAGVEAAAVDRAARDIITGRGYGQYFGHATGHGLGLEIHEEPRISGRNGAVLAEGMVVTIEPGIYIPGWGGIRIEDTVLVRNNGCQVLTGTSKESLINI